MIPAIRGAWCRLLAAVAEAREPSSDDIPYDERFVALHESAHGIVGLALQLPVRHITLVGRDRGHIGGLALLGGPAGADAPTEAQQAEILLEPVDPGSQVCLPRDLWAWLLMTAAGSAADVKSGFSPWLAAGDRAWIERYSEQVIGRPYYVAMKGYSAEFRRFLALVDQHAEYLVDLNWEWIRATATALMERRVLSAAEILKLKPNPGVMTWHR